ncbi:hypothetical protein O0L34_g2335 [Tuta absoluta]|nr:hypothetical protein O0L34_g2335 [Tuta absoluta]
MACRCLPGHHSMYKESNCGDGPAQTIRRTSASQKSTSSWWTPVTSAAARVYDKCAGYNLRHCYFRGFVTQKSQPHLKTTLKEFTVLLCFLLANFVVLAMICARICVHFTCLVMGAARWLRGKAMLKSATEGWSSPLVSNIRLNTDN